MKPVFVLLHSPLVGPSTWLPVAGHLVSTGCQARVPSLLDACVGPPPYWPRISAAVRDDLDSVPSGLPLVLVAHSNAGYFLPTIRAELAHRRVIGSVFVDAALPARSGSTPVASAERLDLLRHRAVDGTMPRWTDWWDAADVAALFPDARTGHAVIDEQPRLPLAYFEQDVPVPEGWDDHPCSYLLFSPPYERYAAEAGRRGWRVAHLPGGHLHQIVDPEGTARQLLELVDAS
ncbi:hypothetical protein GCM10009838_59170 [Catenulispora subtropica]|uniref:AB hydrolase-1 domain-containing protein n=1 Tax=Catenulispora subtropica TaxID=450798 RepID=A0ABP5E062_9ACTN